MSHVHCFFAGHIWVVWVVAYLVTLGGSELFVPGMLSLSRQKDKLTRAEEETKNKKDAKEAEGVVLRTGRIIGKLENFLVVTLVLVGQYTALAVVFAAKGIARVEARGLEEKELASYYILGTLANFTWSLAIAQGARLVVSWAGGPK